MNGIIFFMGSNVGKYSVGPMISMDEMRIGSLVDLLLTMFGRKNRFDKGKS